MFGVVRSIVFSVFYMTCRENICPLFSRLYLSGIFNAVHGCETLLQLMKRCGSEPLDLYPLSLALIPRVVFLLVFSKEVFLDILCSTVILKRALLPSP